MGTTSLPYRDFLTLFSKFRLLKNREKCGTLLTMHGGLLGDWL